MSDISVIILAAGKGTRMKSKLPKVLHRLAGKSLVNHVYDTAKNIGAEKICVVYGHEGDKLLQSCSHFDSSFAEQAEQLGTGHAVDQAIPHINSSDTVLILYGDVPLTKESTLKELVALVSDTSMGLLTVNLENPTGYGRIIRQANKVVGIVEQKDASTEQLEINEVNTGMMSIKGDLLKELLSKVDNKNAQNEYYLTDVIALASQQGIVVKTCQPENEFEVAGVNNRVQLAELERIYQLNHAISLMEQGVTLADPARIDVRGIVNVGQDIFIDANVILSGEVTIEDDVIIESGCVISDSFIGKGSHIKANTVIENSRLESNVEAGPFARIRPDTVLMDKAKVGNFVETKKAVVGKGSKINHLSYVGDAEIGQNVNIGAGTITCNYDGANKHLTVIKDNAFIGSDTQLVAPVVVGKGVTIAAGSTITKDTSNDVLVLSRVQQKEITGWTRPQKKNK